MDGLGLWCLMPFQQYFSFRVAFSLIDGGNRRIPPSCRKSTTHFITSSCIEYTSPWAKLSDDMQLISKVVFR